MWDRKDIACWRRMTSIYGNPQTCLDLQALSDYWAGQGRQISAHGYRLRPVFRDTQFLHSCGTTDWPERLSPLHLALRFDGARTVPANTTTPNGITLVGLRPYSSPQCDPSDGRWIARGWNSRVQQYLRPGYDCATRPTTPCRFRWRSDFRTGLQFHGGLHLQQVDSTRPPALKEF